jgi:Arc/MetJ family transcription regulator
MFSRLSDEALHDQTLQAAAREKSATLVLLEHLAEIERRRLHSARGYTSLWEYVHRALGYSEAQASERVSAMRLMRKLPEVQAKLESGQVTLTATARLASHVRREKLDSESTRELLEQISGKSTREVDRLLAAHSTAAPRPEEKIRAVSREAIRFTLEVDEEFMKLVQRMKELQGPSSLKEAFEAAMREFIRHREPKAQVLRAPEVSSQKRYVPTSVRNAIRIRSQDQCEYVDPVTRRRCESRTRLQFDHIQPLGQGGRTELENLRHYCPSHNAYAAIRAYGVAKMRRYLGGL